MIENHQYQEKEPDMDHHSYYPLMKFVYDFVRVDEWKPNFEFILVSQPITKIFEFRHVRFFLFTV